MSGRHDLVHVTDSNAPPGPSPMSEQEIRDFLAYESTTLLARRDTLIEALAAMDDAIIAIDHDDTLAEVAENIRMANQWHRTADDRRKTHKDPFLSGGRTVDDWYRVQGDGLRAIAAKLQARMDEYARRTLAEKRAIVEAERKRAQAEADRFAQIAAQRLEQGRSAHVALDHAAQAAVAAEQAETAAHQRPSQLTRTRGVYGAVASARETWGWEVEDFALIPRALLMLDPQAVKDLATDRDPSGRPLAVVPGLKWVSTVKMGIR